MARWTRLGEVPVDDVAHGGAGESTDVHAVVVEETRVFTGTQGFDEEVRDFRAGDGFAAGGTRGGDLHSLAVVKHGAGRQPRDLAQIVAHGEHEVEERET